MPSGMSAPSQPGSLLSQGMSPGTAPMQVSSYGQPNAVTPVLLPNSMTTQFTVAQPILQTGSAINSTGNSMMIPGNSANQAPGSAIQTGNIMANTHNPAPIAQLPINVHQPPPGYPTMPPPIPSRNSESAMPHVPAVSSFKLVALHNFLNCHPNSGSSIVCDQVHYNDCYNFRLKSFVASAKYLRSSNHLVHFHCIAAK